jgi:hypothetical protein
MATAAASVPVTSALRAQVTRIRYAAVVAFVRPSPASLQPHLLQTSRSRLRGVGQS